MNICRLNRSFKVCLEKGPTRHTRTPQSSFPEPNTFFNIYCPVATTFPKVRELTKKNRGRVSWAHST